MEEKEARHKLISAMKGIGITKVPEPSPGIRKTRVLHSMDNRVGVLEAETDEINKTEVNDKIEGLFIVHKECIIVVENNRALCKQSSFNYFRIKVPVDTQRDNVFKDFSHISRWTGTKIIYFA